MEGQKFCLKWNNFQRSVTSVFNDLRQDEQLVDITLCCEGQQVKAHRIVLSACSPYFREVLQGNPCQHPIVFLKDTSFEDLRLLVDFMYSGQVDVSQNQLSSFLKTAEMLHVRGLSGEDDQPEEDGSQTTGTRFVDQDKSADVAATYSSNAVQPGPALRRPAASNDSVLPDSPPAAKRRRSSVTDQLSTSQQQQQQSLYVTAATTSAAGDQMAPPVSGTCRIASTTHPTAAFSPLSHRLIKAEQTDCVDLKDVTGSAAPVDAGAIHADVFKAVGFPDVGHNSHDPNSNHASGVEDPAMLSFAAATEDSNAGFGFVCGDCGRQFRSDASLNNHRSMHRGSTRCDLCGSIYSTISAMRRHIRLQHGPRPDSSEMSQQDAGAPSLAFS